MITTRARWSAFFVGELVHRLLHVPAGRQMAEARCVERAGVELLQHDRDRLQPAGHGILPLADRAQHIGHLPVGGRNVAAGAKGGRQVRRHGVQHVPQLRERVAHLVGDGAGEAGVKKAHAS